MPCCGATGAAMLAFDVEGDEAAVCLVDLPLLSEAAVASASSCILRPVKIIE